MNVADKSQIFVEISETYYQVCRQFDDVGVEYICVVECGDLGEISVTVEEGLCEPSLALALRWPWLKRSKRKWWGRIGGRVRQFFSTFLTPAHHLDDKWADNAPRSTDKSGDIMLDMKIFHQSYTWRVSLSLPWLFLVFLSSILFLALSLFSSIRFDGLV